jgi:hypothetical protein
LLFLKALKWRALLCQRPDFHIQTVFDCGALFGNFNRFLQVIDLEQKITADGFFRFGEGTIGYHVSLFPGNDFAFISIQGVAGCYLPLLA